MQTGTGESDGGGDEAEVLQVAILDCFRVSANEFVDQSLRGHLSRERWRCSGHAEAIPVQLVQGILHRRPKWYQIAPHLRKLNELALLFGAAHILSFHDWESEEWPKVLRRSPPAFGDAKLEPLSVLFMLFHMRVFCWN